MESKVTIISSSFPYYTILVEFNDKSFEQTVVSTLSDDKLGKFFLDYADQYKTDWYTLSTEVES